MSDNVIILCVHQIAVILTSDHNDTDSSSPAQLNGASDLLTGRVQHTHAANEGQVSLKRWLEIKKSFKLCHTLVCATTIAQH